MEKLTHGFRKDVATWLSAGLENVLFAHCTYNSSKD
jgi:hypothetical protein